ncbi:MAG TPA: hypothetical protein VN857_17500 [Chthoniobacterales bacterium]|nr:hypothetical protein [Chthoniobacterales bacterium]
MPADFLDYGEQFLIFAHLERSIREHAKKGEDPPRLLFVFASY